MKTNIATTIPPNIGIVELAINYTDDYVNEIPWSIWALILDSEGKIISSDHVLSSWLGGMFFDVGGSVVQTGNRRFDGAVDLLHLHLKHLRDEAKRIVLMLSAPLDSPDRKLNTNGLEVSLKDKSGYQHKRGSWETTAFAPPADQENLECQAINLGEFVRNSSGWSYLSIFQANQTLNIRDLLLRYHLDFFEDEYGLGVKLGEDEAP